MQKRPLFLLVILVAAAVAILLSRSDATKHDPRPAPGATDLLGLPLSSQDFLPKGLALGERENVALSPARLKVLAVDPQGAPVPATTFLATPEAGGESRKAMGSFADWRDISSGQWQLEATAEMRFPATQSLDVQDGPITETQLELRPASQVYGTFLNTYGKSLNSVYVFFLKEGQEHPRGYKNSQAALHARPKSKDGSFTSPLLTPGRYRISAGRAAGKSQLLSDWFELSDFERRSVQIVMEQGAMLEVVPRGASEKASVSLLYFDRGVAESYRARPPKPNKKGELKTSEEIREKAWKKFLKQKMKDSVDGKLIFPAMRPGVYRLEIKDVGGKFRSAQEFEVFQNKPVRINCEIPSWANEKPNKEKPLLDSNGEPRHKSWQALPLDVEVWPAGMLGPGKEGIRLK